jgi:transcriptional regulator with XRE-family HTH domain
MTTHQSRARKTNGVPVPQLATLRKNAGLSQRTLAKRARLCEQTISRLEQGANARYDTIELLAQALKVPPTRLIRRPHQEGFQAPSVFSEHGVPPNPELRQRGVLRDPPEQAPTQARLSHTRP